MQHNQALAFFLFAVIAAVTPGPSNVMITATGSAVGLWRGMPSALGAASGMALLIFASFLGLGGLIQAVPPLVIVLKWLGAIFLLWLAWKIATSGKPEHNQNADPVGFVQAFFFQWINPKGWLVAISAAATYSAVEAGPAIMADLQFAALFFAAALPSAVCWLALGAVLNQITSNERQARAINITLGLALAATVAMILV
jgi:threonine/homoserine/homoserine lactone efflux protein